MADGPSPRTSKSVARTFLFTSLGDTHLHAIATVRRVRAGGNAIRNHVFTMADGCPAPARWRRVAWPSCRRVGVHAWARVSRGSLLTRQALSCVRVTRSSVVCRAAPNRCSRSQHSTRPGPRGGTREFDVVTHEGDFWHNGLS